MTVHAWSITGSVAGSRALREALALERQHRKKQSMREYERRDEERNARAVGIGIRKSVREQQGRNGTINVRPKAARRGRDGGRRCPRFETMTGLTLPRPSHVGSDGFSSFHFKWTCRGLGKRRQSSHRFRGGEAVRHLRYILREAAREQTENAVVSNISHDPDIIAGLFSAVEELEHHGRANANVYVSIVVSLPHELSAEQRADLLARICAIFDRHDLPHVGVLHDADERGDQRNKHAHIMLSLRPFRREADGSFSLSAGTCADLNDATYIKAVRHEIADLLNGAMMAAGHARRFTAKSNAERGFTPIAKGEGKSTPGAKHRERRIAEVGKMTAEQVLRAGRIDAWHTVQAELVSMVSAPPVDRAAMLADARRHVERARGNPAPVPVATSQPKTDGLERTPGSSTLDTKPPREDAPSPPQPLRPVPAMLPISTTDPLAGRKRRRKVAIDVIVERICNPAGPTGASEEVRAPLRPWVRRIGEEIAAGRMSLELDGTTILAGGVMAEPMTWLDRVAGLKGGYQALRLMAGAVQAFGPEPGHERYGRRIEPRDSGAASAGTDRGPAI